MAENYKYRAFISYSHADEKWASWLHKALETYRVPKYLIGEETRFGPVPERLGSVFRDREELSTATSLGEELTQALTDSACQIVICSPRAAKSHWTNEEILTYKRLGRSDRIFCLIVDGEPGVSARPELADQECFPPALRYVMGDNGELTDQLSEPIAADARKGKDNRQNAKLKLIAGMLGVGFDALKQREHQRRQRRMAYMTAAAVTGMAITSGLATAAWFARLEAEEQRNLAQREAETAKRTTEFMVGMFEVSDPSESRGNTITAREILENGAARIQKELADQPVIQATLMHTIGDVYRSLGLYSESGQLLREALSRRRSTYGDDHEDVAQTKAQLAKVLSLQAQYESAEELYRAALATQRQLLGGNTPEVAETLAGFADLLTMEGRYQEAEDLLRESLEVRRAVYGRTHLEIARGLQFLAMNSYDQGDHDAAESMLRDAIAMQRMLLDGRPHPALSDSLNNLALVLWDTNQYDEVEALYREALAMNRALYDETHPTVTVTLNNLAFVLHDKGDYAAAEAQFRDVIRLRREMFGDDHPDVARAMNNLAFLLYDKGEHRAAVELAKDSLTMYQRLFPEGHPEVATALTNLARWLIVEREYGDSESMLLDSLAMQHALSIGDHPRYAATLTELARLYLDTGRYQQAAAAANEARLKMAAMLSEDHWRTAWAGVIEGAALVRSGESSAGRLLLARSVEIIESNPSARASEVVAAQALLADLQL